MSQEVERKILERLRKVVAEVLRVDEQTITLDTRYKEDLGADSLDTVTLLMALEEEFKGQISDEEAEGLTTVGKTVAFIKDKMPAS
ncbi:MAG: acyl carrier protein [Chitinivibrionales bacterium]|nr:acyl carrier protein [Chitinivibrionales bacterium]MBD3358823.1 acyl carrier protein [Chitinivibrionales bacterium]